MRVVLFGASGMIGKGVLLECLDSEDVDSVLVVGRSPTGIEHAKLREILHRDFLDFSAIADELRGMDACLWCLGVSAAGMSEADYTRITYAYTKAAAETLLRLDPEIAFCFVSGAGTDAHGRAMWARVKGRTEELLLGMGFRRAFMFRPAYIHPMRGVTSKTKLYRALYVIAKPLYPVMRRLFPDATTTTVMVGRAMIAAAVRGAPKPILESADINALANDF
jgi:uncharacterized protein YbjT (DUF2867 family)